MNARIPRDPTLILASADMIEGGLHRSAKHRRREVVKGAPRVVVEAHEALGSSEPGRC